MSADLLRLAGVTKSFGRVVVATDLDIRLSPGQTLGIVGPNGAGKTTLFAMVSGDLRPDHGSIEFAGHDITNLPPHKRSRNGIGRTYQVPRPFEKMTVFENVLVCAHEGAGQRRRAGVDLAGTTLERTGLLPVANRTAGSLTLLQRKRLEVARALATEPRLLLLDEVAGGLTEPEVAELVTMVLDVNASGIAIMWIEHVVQALIASVDRLACLAGGKLVADGKPAAVLADPTVRELYLGHAAPTGEDVA